MGLATTDVTGTVTTPLKTIDRQETELSDELKTVIQSNSIDQIVIGYPEPLKVDSNERTREVDDFIHRFLEPLDQPYIKVSERYTTKKAKRLRRNRNDTPVPPDSEAAALILQHYIDQESKS